MKVCDNVYSVKNKATNTILIMEDTITLIDAGMRGSVKTIASFLGEQARSPDEVSLIIITHGHFDHIGGLAEIKALTGARVAIHRNDVSDTSRPPPYPGYTRPLFRLPFLRRWHQRFLLSAEDVDLPLEGDEVLEPLGGLQIIHTPGHTPGSISLYSPARKLLIVGDALSKPFRDPNLPYRMISSNHQQALESVKLLTQLEVDILCFGHGRPIFKDASTRLRELVRKRRL